MDKPELTKKYKSIFKGDDLLFFFSPGRINLIGEHIDYNGGSVFPCAISLGIYAVVGIRNDNLICLYSEGMDEGIDVIDLNKELTKEKKWTIYVKGVLDELQKDGYTYKKGFNVYLFSTLPKGASLSSSAALELLFGEIFRKIGNYNLSDLQLVKLCQRAENNFVGIHCGIMDQFAIGMSKKNYAILLNCASVEYEYVPLNLLNNSILILNTKKSRSLVSSKYNERFYECQKALELINQNYRKIKYLCELSIEELKYIKIEDEVIFRRLKYVVYEQHRVMKMYDALLKGELDKVGIILNESHESLKNDYEVTGIELDTIVELAQKQDGVLGARMIGAGFAGCAIALVNNDYIEDVIKNISSAYKEKIGYDCEILVSSTSDKQSEF
ncbi:MAG: galactokinase [Bacillales bacterium]|nr:galactokinase [Bacillales bacterium]